MDSKAFALTRKTHGLEASSNPEMPLPFPRSQTKENNLKQPGLTSISRKGNPRRMIARVAAGIRC